VPVVQFARETALARQVSAAAVSGLNRESWLRLPLLPDPARSPCESERGPIHVVALVRLSVRRDMITEAVKEPVQRAAKRSRITAVVENIQRIHRRWLGMSAFAGWDVSGSVRSSRQNTGRRIRQDPDSDENSAVLRRVAWGCRASRCR